MSWIFQKFKPNTNTVSTSAIDWKRLCAEWDIKRCTLTHSNLAISSWNVCRCAVFIVVSVGWL